jgi:predicted NUDIX family NTP pyrophosphohydrolase
MRTTRTLTGLLGRDADGVAPARAPFITRPARRDPTAGEPAEAATAPMTIQTTSRARPPRRSAGLLVFRRGHGAVEFLLVHPGGPFWRHRDAGAWSIPKGHVENGEDELAAALREFEEEVGVAVSGAFVRLADQRQRRGKTVLCWLVEANLDLASFHSNSVPLEWPPRSGRTILVPECDRAEYIAADVAVRKILAGQRGFIEEAIDRIGRDGR